MDYNNMLVLSATICFAFLFGRIFVKPIKFIFKVVLNSILGCLLIALIKYLDFSFSWNFRNTWCSFTYNIKNLYNLEDEILLLRELWYYIKIKPEF